MDTERVPLDETGQVERARQGDTAAWEALVRLHQESVFRLAYLLLGDSDDAEDAAQETFIRAFYALPRFDPSKPLRPWLLSITANTARNRRRSLSRYFAALTRLAGEKRVEEYTSPSAQPAELLWKAVRRLSQTDQEAVYLRYFLELSEAEMASAWNVAPGTVKSRLHRSVERLRSLIERDYPELREEFEA